MLACCPYSEATFAPGFEHILSADFKVGEIDNLTIRCWFTVCAFVVAKRMNAVKAINPHVFHDSYHGWIIGGEDIHDFNLKCFAAKFNQVSQQELASLAIQMLGDPARDVLV